MDAAALREDLPGLSRCLRGLPVRAGDVGLQSAGLCVRRCPPGSQDVRAFRPGARDFSVSLKCEPALAEQLRAAHPEITGAWHMNKKHWNGVRLDGSLPDEMVRDMVEDS